MILVLYALVCGIFIAWCFEDCQDVKSQVSRYDIERLEDEIDFLQEQLDELYDKVFALEDLTEVLHDVEDAE